MCSKVFNAMPTYKRSKYSNDKNKKMYSKCIRNVSEMYPKCIRNVSEMYSNVF